MKKGFVIFVSVLFLVLFLNFSTIMAMLQHNVMSVKTLPQERLSSELEGKEQGSDFVLPSFNGQTTFYDLESNTVFITQSVLESGWEGRLTAEGCTLFFEADSYLNKKQDAMREGHVFHLYCLTEDAYTVYNVVFTGMPVMSITTVDGDLESGIMRLEDQYHTSTEYQSADCTFSIRGGSSYSYEKSSYKLTLTHSKLSLLGMRKDDDWILNALYDDAGLIHNKLSYDVWQEIAGSNQVKNDEGTTMEYAELFIDNEYLGVYGVTERIDRKELSLNKKDILYKCRAYRIPEEHNYSNEMTDDMEPIFILKYPNEFTDEDWLPLKNWVDYFCKGQFEQYDEGAGLLNMENAIDSNLYNLLICGSDNTRKNQYYIAEYQKDGTYVFKKVPWDMNATWGNPWVSDEECLYSLYEPDSIYNMDTWCTDVSTLYYYDAGSVSALLLNRWKELREKIITSEHITGLLDTEFEYLKASGAYDRNYRRWPQGTEFWDDSYIYEYVNGRIDFLDGYFEMLYEDSMSETVYNGVDYSGEFDTRYYWERNRETLEALYPYDKNQLLEHYVLYGKPYGLIAKKQDREMPPGVSE